MNRFTFVSLISLMLFFVLMIVLGCTFMVGYGLNSGVGGGVHLTSPLLNGLLVASAILTFPLGWLSLGLAALIDNPLPVFGGVIANCILWAQLLWKLQLWRQKKRKQ